DPHINEEIVGEALRPYRDKIVIATKFGIRFDRSSGKYPCPLIADARPEAIRKSVEGSLKRLGTDCIDLYYQHRIDPNIPPKEVAGVMSELIKEGKIKAWGISETGEEYLRKAHAVCSVTAIQNRYSMMYRDYEKLFPVLEELGISFVAFSPMANGFLTAKYDTNSKFEHGTDYRGTMPQFQKEAMEQNQELLNLLRYTAEDKNATPAQISLSWMLCKKPFIIPIPGTRNPDRLQENADSADINLTQQEVQALDTALDNIPMSAVFGGSKTRSTDNN
ncbi:MAG: aldo/keto reductase, partial [Lachnospiraceae bacterium]|nr:aldo/keto reductase [Lachnospiraceae bacterium]